MFIDFREREKETSMWGEKHQSVDSRTHPEQGWNQQPRYVPWPGIKPATFWGTGWHSNQLSHPARATDNFWKGHHNCETRDGNVPHHSYDAQMTASHLGLRDITCIFPIEHGVQNSMWSICPKFLSIQKPGSGANTKTIHFKAPLLACAQLGVHGLAKSP